MSLCIQLEDDDHPGHVEYVYLITYQVIFQRNPQNLRNHKLKIITSPLVFPLKSLHYTFSQNTILWNHLVSTGPQWKSRKASIPNCLHLGYHCFASQFQPQLLILPTKLFSTEPSTLVSFFNTNFQDSAQESPLSETFLLLLLLISFSTPSIIIFAILTPTMNYLSFHYFSFLTPQCRGGILLLHWLTHWVVILNFLDFPSRLLAS